MNGSALPTGGSALPKNDNVRPEYDIVQQRQEALQENGLRASMLRSASAPLNLVLVSRIMALYKFTYLLTYLLTKEG